MLVPASALTKGGALCGSVATGSGSATAGSNQSTDTSGAFGLRVAEALPLGVALALVFVASQSSLLVG